MARFAGKEHQAGQVELPMIIVIEDDKIGGWALSMVLQDAGYETLLAAAGEEILERVEATGAEPAAIISDFFLEGRMNGVESARRLARKKGDKIPTIITSHHHNDEARRLARAEGYHFCPKPMDPERVLGLLESELAPK